MLYEGAAAFIRGSPYFVNVLTARFILLMSWRRGFWTFFFAFPDGRSDFALDCGVFGHFSSLLLTAGPILRFAAGFWTFLLVFLARMSDFALACGAFGHFSPLFLTAGPKAKKECLSQFRSTLLFYFLPCTGISHIILLLHPGNKSEYLLLQKLHGFSPQKQGLSHHHREHRWNRLLLECPFR